MARVEGVAVDRFDDPYLVLRDDDHVLLASPTSALTAHPYVLQQMPYKDSDLLPIARGWNTVIVIAVPAAMEVKTMDELVAMTRVRSFRQVKSRCSRRPTA